MNLNELPLEHSLLTDKNIAIKLVGVGGAGFEGDGRRDVCGRCVAGGEGAVGRRFGYGGEVINRSTRLRHFASGAASARVPRAFE